METYLERYYRVKQKAIDRLGGECVKCGETEGLEFDHIDPKTKSFNFSVTWQNEGQLYQELEKCQLLCYDCHKVKTSKEQGVGHGQGLTGKRNCRCKLCAPLKNKYQEKFNSKRDRRTL